MSMPKKELKRLFPNLMNEIEEDHMNISNKSVSKASEQKTYEESKDFSGYNPDIIDFIRRCDTEDEALEIIKYMEKKLEISKEYAKHLIKELKTKGVRSFGPKKETDYYSKRRDY